MYNKGGAGQKLRKSCMFCWNTRFWNQWIKGQLKAFEKASKENLDTPLNEAFLKSVNRRCSCMLSKDANSTDVIQSHNIWYLSLPLYLPLLLIFNVFLFWTPSLLAHQAAGDNREESHNQKVIQQTCKCAKAIYLSILSQLSIYPIGPICDYGTYLSPSLRR